MSLAASNVLRNHRGLYFEYVGDGSTTQISVPHGSHHRGARTASVFVVTGGSGAAERHSGKGGFSFPTNGTAVSASVAINADSTVTVTTSPAVSNGVKAFVAVVFGDDAN